MDGETQSHVKQVERRATTPVAGAVAGIAFAVLFGVSVAILTITVADVTDDSGAWLEDSAGALKFALALVPFAGLFFLWFIAVARERLGRFEDQFFSTVFIGSLPSESLAYMFRPKPWFFSFWPHTVRRPCSLAIPNAGMRMLMSSAMIAITTSNSMSVKPLCFCIANLPR